MKTNPFNITKAVDYTDEELNKYWVDFPEKSFGMFVKPTSDMPMLILGSKGSGKTHIMKHFSYTMQSIRFKDDLLNGIKKDGYIGAYLRCSGLNGFKFNGRGETEEVWRDIFAYYLELWLSQILLNNIISLIEKENIEFNELQTTLDILELFDTNDLPNNLKGLTHLVKYFSDLQKDIDYTINNRVFTKTNIKDSIRILASPGSLIFGIPNVLSKKIEAFKNLKFLFLLDEYENFNKEQQRYFNTLIRERKNPTCFKIGARRYGIRTFETLSAGEEIKIGSEFEQIDLDEKFREDSKNYSVFIKQICINRIKNNGIEISEVEFKEKFLSQNDDLFLENIKGEKRIHLKKLEQKLSKKKLSNEISNQILINLTSENIIAERINLILFYRDWNKNLDLLNSSKKIKKECEMYLSGNNDSNHFKVLGKFKKDIIDSIYRDYKSKIPTYCGFENLIKISNGIPRHFLIIMKHIFRWNEFHDIDILGKDNISIDSQLNAIADTTNWFLEDSRYPGISGINIKECILRLCDYLRELRFSDIPPECSISTISIKPKVLPIEIDEMLKFLEQYSYIIKIDNNRRDKNSNSRNQTFQINGLLASQWELSLSRRGIIDLSLDDIMSIFLPENESKYKTLLSQVKFKYNAPFSLNNNYINTLFD